MSPHRLCIYIHIDYVYRTMSGICDVIVYVSPGLMWCWLFDVTTSGYIVKYIFLKNLRRAEGWGCIGKSFLRKQQLKLFQWAVTTVSVWIANWRRVIRSSCCSAMMMTSIVCLSLSLSLFQPEWHIVDPICTFLFSVLVLLTTFAIMRDTLTVLMEG